MRVCDMIVTLFNRIVSKDVSRGAGPAPLVLSKCAKLLFKTYRNIDDRYQRRVRPFFACAARESVVREQKKTKSLRAHSFCSAARQ